MRRRDRQEQVVEAPMEIRNTGRVLEPGTLNSHTEGNTMRRLKAASLFALTMGLTLPALAAGIPVKLYKNPNCGCCNTYADYLRGQGFEVEAINTTDLASVKKKYGVPAALEGCHTAVAGRYVFEGLVPADLITRVLDENRPIKGIALPGMPAGAPGMSASAPGMQSMGTGLLNVYLISEASPPSIFSSFREQAR
jgi:hypothetical protein